MEKMKRNNGITLIALVITIIVLLILAGITINLTIGQDGILKRAEEAGRNYTNAADYERTQIAGLANEADDIIASLTGANNNQEEEWNATDEKYFTWGSDDPNDGLYYRLTGINETYASSLPEDIVIPKRCMDIYHAAFSNYTSYSEHAAYSETALNSLKNIKSVKLPNTVTSIGIYAFDYCTALEKIEVPESVICIGEKAFYSTAWYDNLSEGLIILGKVAYGYKGTIPSSITIPEGVVSISTYAFIDQKSEGSNSTELVSIILPSTLTTINNYAFRCCKKIENITIPDNVTTIGAGAFSECSALTSVTIPDKVTTIGDNAFYGVPHIYYNGAATGSPWGASVIN